MKPLPELRVGELTSRLAAWLRRPLIDAAPWTLRFRHYAFFLLLLLLSSPLLHSHLDIPLSFPEIIAHSAIVTGVVALVILLVEVAAAWMRRFSRRENAVSAGGFLLRAAVAYASSGLFLEPLHRIFPFTRAIMEKHTNAVPENMVWHVLPLALLIVYITYQVMRKDRLEREVSALRQINDELQHLQSTPRPDSEPEPEPGTRLSAESIHVRSNGIAIPLPVESILRIEADENYCHVVARDDAGEQPKRHMVRMTLSEAVAMLPEPPFLQTHRSHVVNLRHVSRVVRDGRQRMLVLADNECVPVSRARTGHVQSRLRELLLDDRRRPAKEAPRFRG